MKDSLWCLVINWCFTQGKLPTCTQCSQGGVQSNCDHDQVLTERKKERKVGEISLMTPLSKTVHLHSLVFGVIKLVWDKQAYLCEKDEHNMRFDNLAIS